MKNNALTPWRNTQGGLPPTANADIVCAMDETLAVSRRLSSSSRPLVCSDATSKQQVKETREPLPSPPGQPQRYDDAYARNGVSTLCRICAPLAGGRQVKVTDRRTHVDGAHGLKDLVDGHCPHAEHLVLMADNVNNTPTHGRWLAMAEIELRMLQWQC